MSVLGYPLEHSAVLLITKENSLVPASRNKGVLPCDPPFSISGIPMPDARIPPMKMAHARFILFT
jgi:hypothetical protein